MKSIRSLEGEERKLNNEKRTKIYAYLSHTFGLRVYVRDIVMPAILKIGIETKNPFYDQEGRCSREHIKFADKIESKGMDPTQVAAWWKTLSRLNKSIVNGDLGLIDSCDITIANMEDISIGTTSEIFYSGSVRKIPVFLLSQKKQVREHPWIIYACSKGKIVETLPELLKALRVYLHKSNALMEENLIKKEG